MNQSTRLLIEVEHAQSDPDHEVLPNGLEPFNDSRWPYQQQRKTLAVFARRTGRALSRGSRAKPIPAGSSHSLPLGQRCAAGKGIGRRLMGDAEMRALERGCHSAWVDTFSFQAPGFYPRLGYTVFGELDYPPGHKRIFLQKRLAGGA